MQFNKMKRVTVYLYQKIKLPVRRKMINFCLPYFAVAWKHINCLLTGGIALSIYVTSIVNKWIIFSKYNKNDLMLSIY
jgi:hypothetical protein